MYQRPLPRKRDIGRRKRKLVPASSLVKGDRILIDGDEYRVKVPGVMSIRLTRKGKEYALPGAALVVKAPLRPKPPVDAGYFGATGIVDVPGVLGYGPGPASYPADEGW